MYRYHEISYLWRDSYKARSTIRQTHTQKLAEIDKGSSKEIMCHYTEKKIDQKGTE